MTVSIGFLALTLKSRNGAWRRALRVLHVDTTRPHVTAIYKIIKRQNFFTLPL